MSEEQQQPPQAGAVVEQVTEAKIEPGIEGEVVNTTAEATARTDAALNGKLGILNNVSVTLTIEVGRTTLKIRDLLSLSKGSIVELDKLAGEPVDIYVNGKMIAQGNIITANGKYCVRLLTVNQNSTEL